MDDLSLRPFDRPDFDRLLAWIDSPESLMLWAGPFFRFPLDAAQLEAYRASAEPGSSPRRIHTACEANGERVGHIELNRHSARLSRVLVDPARRGQGFGGTMARRSCVWPSPNWDFTEWTCSCSTSIGPPSGVIKRMASCAKGTCATGVT
jgi:RimJ/RimL family protein N-acetyltransferase